MMSYKGVNDLGISMYRNIKVQFHMEESFMQKPHQNGFS